MTNPAQPFRPHDLASDDQTARRRAALYSGSPYERQYSYARAVAIGRHLWMSGTTGYDYPNDRLIAGAGPQTTQIFDNARRVLAQAGFDLRHVVRVRIHIADPADYDAVMDVYAQTFRGIDPACTTVQAGLFDPEIRVEIDMDAVLDDLA